MTCQQRVGLERAEAHFHSPGPAHAMQNVVDNGVPATITGLPSSGGQSCIQNILPQTIMTPGKYHHSSQRAHDSAVLINAQTNPHLELSIITSNDQSTRQARRTRMPTCQQNKRIAPNSSKVSRNQINFIPSLYQPADSDRLASQTSYLGKYSSQSYENAHE